MAVLFAPNSKTPSSGAVSVGTTAVRLPTQAATEIVIQWDATNTGLIYLGTSSGVTSATAGYVLDTNSRSLPIGVNNVNNIYAIASVSGQTLHWMAS